VQLGFINSKRDRDGVAASAASIDNSSGIAELKIYLQQRGMQGLVKDSNIGEVLYCKPTESSA